MEKIQIMAGEGFIHDMILKLKSNQSLIKKQRNFRDRKSNFEKDLRYSQNSILDVESHAKIREKLWLRSRRQANRNFIILLIIFVSILLMTYFFFDALI